MLDMAQRLARIEEYVSNQKSDKTLWYSAAIATFVSMIAAIGVKIFGI
jgi:hypothetical protein